MPAAPASNVLQPQEVVLSDFQRAALTRYIHTELGATLQAHEKRQKKLAKFLRAYKATPEYEVKNFPWPNASNLVIPIVAITVDTVAARLQRAVLGAKDPVECHVNTASPFSFPIPQDPSDPSSQPGQGTLDDKLLRDWARWFLSESGARDRLRTVFADMPIFGDAFVSPTWVEETKVYHAYDTNGSVIEQEVPQYTGVKWNIAAATDVFWPTGYDEFQQLPWFAIRLRYSKPELYDFVDRGAFERVDIDALRPKIRDDAARKEQKKNDKLDDMPNEIFELYELRGKFEIKSETPGVPSTWEEVVLTFSQDNAKLLRAIYNPYFGKARHFVKIPYLVQPHEIASMGAAEQVLPFQEEASTAHNQVIDSATAANAGVTILSTNVNIGPNEEIHPGKTVTTDGNPKEDINIVHLSEPSPSLGAAEEKAFFMAEKRSGVSVYNMGMESPTVGSRATATGTTALINEGNQRFWVSIDDMRFAIEELLYLTIQLEQQMRPEGYFFEKGRFIQFPPGDPRTSFALRLALTSESINRDIEVQQMQLLIQVCNNYYMQLNQAMMVVMNPQFPPQAKMMVISTIMASSQIVRKFVERFDVENLDMVVPTILQALQSMSNNIQGAMTNGPGAMGAPPGGPPQIGPGGPGMGAQPPFGPPAGGARPNGNAAPPGIV